MTIQETLTEGIRLLKSPGGFASIDIPALDASILLAHVLEIGKTELVLRGNEDITEKDKENYITLLQRRRGGECVAYILGKREFRGLEFKVNHHVLVPRPDTETLVEAALEYIDSRGKNESLSVLDLCTGSGALAISLLNERPFLHITASDISSQALEVAAHNSKTLDPKPHSLHFIQSDLFENIPGRFDIIVSNPPYIPSDQLISLAPEVRREPPLALDGGEDGLLIIRKIVSQASDCLLPGGVLLLEASPEQMPVIRELLETEGFGGIKIRKDLAGRDRVISTRWEINKADYN